MQTICILCRDSSPLCAEMSSPQDDKDKEGIAIRTRTFIHWINHSLKSKSFKITNLNTDLEDGVILIKLMESLAPGKKAPGRYAIYNYYR